MFSCHLNLSWINIKLSTDISMHELDEDANDADDDDDPDYQPSFDITAIMWEWNSLIRSLYGIYFFKEQKFLSQLL